MNSYDRHQLTARDFEHYQTREPRGFTIFMGACLVAVGVWLAVAVAFTF